MTKKSSVFINCPFDEKYKPLFDAIIFAVWDCGFEPLCALSSDDAGRVRVRKINRMIATCTYGIHDISRTELDDVSKLPRFNMPFELGLFLGAKNFGKAKQRKKVTLIFDKEPYRYQKFLSDIAGQDIHSHNNQPAEAIKIVRNWLQSSIRNDIQNPLPSGKKISERFAAFTVELPALCSATSLDKNQLTFRDYTWLVKKWLGRNTVPRS